MYNNFTSVLRKKLMLMLIALMYTLTGFSQNFTIGTGTAINSNTTYPAPYGNWYTGAKHQFLVLASELTAAGVTTQRMIQNVCFNVASVQGVALDNFVIKMGNTSATSLSTTYITGLTQVYSVSAYTEYSGWNTHTLSTPFVWDGTSNLVVEVCFDKYAGTYNYTYNALTYYSTTSFNSCNYYYSDGGGVCPTSTGYTATTSRTNMKFLITTPVSYDVVMNQIVSPTAWGVGNNTLVVQAANYGTTALSSADFGYQLGASTPVTQNNVSISPARSTGQTYNHTFSTALNIPTAGTYTLKVWARNPNNTGEDSIPTNDTLTTTICTGISGSYTINPTGSGTSNYTSFTAAITVLNNCGVSGPCTFTVSPGVYTEKLTLNNIVGTSATNTIVFDGVDSATRKIVYNETGTPTNPAVINFVGASYITFKNLGITAQGTSTGIGVTMQTGSNFNNIIKCNIRVSETSTSSYCFGFGVCGATYSTASTGSNNHFENCIVIGGYVGASLYVGSANGAVNNVIRGNKFSSVYYMGLYTYYQTNDTIMDNTLVFRSSSNLTYGIYNYYNLNYHIERNMINKFSYMGIYSYAYNIASTNATLYNNIFNGSNSYVYSNQYGMYMYYTNGVNIYHNTVYCTGSNAYGAYIGYGTGMNIRNNIFHSTGASAYCIYVPSGSSGMNSFDYNILYSASATTFAYWGNTYTDLPSLKAGASGFHQKSISKVANFVSLTALAEDLHLTASSPAATGDATVNVSLDVDHEARCLFAPTIGADESKYTTGPPVAGFTGPDTIFVNSPVILFNNNPADAPLGHQWYLNGILISSSVNLPYTFTAIGTYTLKLVTMGCSGVDSIIKVITVYNPTQKPISDFISDLNVVETYQQVRFTDLSIKGPTYWYWTIIPNAGVNYNNGTSNLSQNPVLSFSNAGLYQICLWDSNSVGRSVQACKVAYILVRATTSMCIFPFDTKVASGTIYDDGGPTGNYSTGGTCNFLINPCASSVTLKFSQFNLAGSAYLRIYNGKNNLAPPLHPGLGFTGTVIPGGTTGIIATSGQMYIEFAKGTTSAPGFAATWTSVATSAPVPTGTLLGPTTVYDCGALSTYTYSPTSLSFPKDEAYYSWYFNYTGPGSFPDVEGTGLYTEDWSYSPTGIYIMRLDIEGCGGIQTIYDTITVATPTTGPVVDFKADLLNATPSDVVNLTDLSTLDPIWWKWTITGPGPVNAVSGNSNTKNYGVKFSIPGSYTVQLKDSNCIGSNTLTKTAYITVVDYCIPSVGTMNADFAIERFVFGRADTIINNTVYGLDYTNTSPAIGTVTYRDNTNKVKNYVINNVTIANKAVEAVVGLGESFNFKVYRHSNFNDANFKIWIDYNQDGTFQSSELVASSGLTSGISFSGSITIPQSAKIGYTRLRIGTNQGSLSNTPCGANVFGDYNDYHIKVTPDITPPVITVAGNVDTVYVEIGRVFNDPGITVTGATTITHTGIAFGDTVKVYPSIQVHTITAVDASSNTAIRNITVVATPDVTKPVISKLGTDTVYSEVGAAYTDLGATANDFYFGSLTSSIVATSTVNINILGTYTVTYDVNDASGNAAIPVVRTVIVRDTQVPVITINGANPLYVNVFSTFNAPTATVTDNYYTGLSYTITGGPVNMSLIGPTQLFYNAQDGSGNVAATKTLDVIVQDVTAPQITLIPQDTMIIDCISLTTVPEPGYIVSDNYYQQNQITVSKVGTVNLNVLGTYVVRYYVSDPSGNVDSSKIRVYKIVDRTAPVIALKGLSIMNWQRWKAFVDPGTTIFDRCDPTATVTSDYSQLDVNLDGLYEIDYTSTDISGNIAAVVKRYVNIYTALNGVNNNGGNNLFMVYPNPNNGLVNIDMNIENATSANIMIYDANGKVVYTNTNVNPVNNKLQIDLSAQASGMYFIKIVTDNFSSSRSFSIQK